VVQDHEDEVFVHGGSYWVRRGDRWYRARGPQAAFVFVEARLVPEPLRRLPPGHYRRYHPPQKVIVVQERKLDKKEEKRLRKEEERERREYEHDRDRDHDHDHDHGHDRGH
jgi:hypothetical protein